MRAWSLIVLCWVGCGREEAPASSSSTLPPRQAKAPVAPPAQERTSDELRPLRLSVLQGRLAPGTVFYLLDRRQDPGGRLGERPHPLRDIFRPLGRYEMRFSRKGYKDIDVEVRLTLAGPSPALEDIPLGFEPTDELAGRYREAEEALGAGDAKRAREALERVRGLDENYLKTPDLVLKLKDLEDRLARERQAEQAARECLRKGDLEGAARAAALGPDIQHVKRTRDRFAEAITRFDLPSAEAALARLRETLTPRDPGNRDRADQVDELKTIRRLLQTYEQVCLDPQAVEERLEGLWDQDASPGVAELARGIERFCRYARYTRISHEPFSFVRRGDEAEVRAHLRVRFAIAAGESSLREIVLVRLKKTDKWRLAGYGRVE